MAKSGAAEEGAINLCASDDEDGESRTLRELQRADDDGSASEGDDVVLGDMARRAKASRKRQLLATGESRASPQVASSSSSSSSSSSFATSGPASATQDGSRIDETAQLMQEIQSKTTVTKNRLQDLQYQIQAIEIQRNALNDQLTVLYLQREEAEHELQAFKMQAHGAKSNNKDWNSETFAHSGKVRQVLRNVFGFGSFRSLQLRAINATLSGVDCFVVMPTGAGKSLIYQLPAVVEERKVTVVISPLLSLSLDQVLSLQKKNIPAAMLSGEMPQVEQRQILASVKGLAMRLLFITPEKMSKSKVLMSALEDLYERNALGRFVVDEAHCCSTMGHDFRADYNKLHILKSRFPEAPILAVTATATTAVENSVCQTLLGRSAASSSAWLRFRTSFNRSNLMYKVQAKTGTAANQLKQLATDIKTKFACQCGIVYCFSRSDTENAAKALQEHGVLAAAYHAYLEPEEKHRVHMAWSSYDAQTAAMARAQGLVQVICATSAFGMGIDKPDVRFIVHMSLPKNMEAYCQESGRAGRDGNPATCIVYYKRADVAKVSTLVSDALDGANKLLRMVRYCEGVAECRRKHMAEIFGEPYREELCNGQCDVCVRNADQGDFTEQNATAQAKTMAAIIEEAYKKGGKSANVTMIQLVTKWRKECATAGKWSVDQAEQLCMHMLLEGFLSIHWRTSAYTTNAYVALGPRAAQLRSGFATLKYSVLSTSTKARSSSARKESNKKQQQQKTGSSSTTTTTTTPSKSSCNSQRRHQGVAGDAGRTSSKKTTRDSASGVTKQWFSPATVNLADSPPCPARTTGRKEKGIKNKKKRRANSPVLSLSGDSSSEVDFVMSSTQSSIRSTPIVQKHGSKAESQAKKTISPAADLPRKDGLLHVSSSLSSTSASRRAMSSNVPNFSMMSSDEEDEARDKPPFVQKSSGSTKRVVIPRSQRDSTGDGRLTATLSGARVPPSGKRVCRPLKAEAVRVVTQHEDEDDPLISSDSDY